MASCHPSYDKDLSRIQELIQSSGTQDEQAQQAHAELTHLYKRFVDLIENGAPSSIRNCACADTSAQWIRK